MEKSVIRKDLLKRRDSLNSNVWKENSLIIESNILKSKVYKNADIIMCYADYHGEVGTLTIIDDALLKSKQVFLPKVLENFDEARMDFFEIFSTCELIHGYNGILEPTGNKKRVFEYEKNKDKNILMLVPGVGFSKDGKRIGYGKGYYDNYLVNKPAILKAGMCFSLQIIDDIPVNENDIPLDFIISENTPISEINKFDFR